MRKTVFKILSLVLALAFVLAPAAASAEGEEVVTYYAEIVDFTALYDQYTETIEFDIEFDGVVFEDRFFTAIVYCSQLVDGEWVEDTEYTSGAFQYRACHTEPTHFTSSIKLSKEVFFGSEYKDFKLYVRGDSVDAGEDIGGKYYTLNSGTVPVTLKDAPTGDFYTLSADITPKETVTGGTVVLTLYLDEISPNLSGGLREIGFTLCYDKALLMLTQAEFTAEKSTCSFSDGTPTADGIRLGLTSETGVMHDRTVAIKLYFRALKGGTASFTVKSVTGKDLASHSFTSDGYPLSATAEIADSSAILGDVNGDGEINSIDAALILKYDVGIIDTVDNADVNRDGDINSIDAALILKYDVGIIDGFDG